MNKASRKNTFCSLIDRLVLGSSETEQWLILLTEESAEREAAAVKVQKLMKGMPNFTTQPCFIRKWPSLNHVLVLANPGRRARLEVEALRKQRAEMAEKRAEAATIIQSALRQRQVSCLLRVVGMFVA